jgi:hypothetical protein
MTNTCAICGEHVGRSRVEGFTGWANAEDEIVLREVLVVVHKECYMRVSPDERKALLEEAEERE